MSEKLTREEVAALIRARQIQKKQGLAPDTSISGICHAADISRKTGYKWLAKFGTQQLDKQHELTEMLSTLEQDHKQLQEAHDDLTFKYKGLELAWEIHRVDDLLKEKKSTSAGRSR